MASERAAALAEALAEVNREAMAWAGSCSEAQWDLVVPGEDWTVGVVLHHIAEGYSLSEGWLVLMTRGEAVGDTAEGIDQRNVEHNGRDRFDRDDTVALLAGNGARAEATLRGLSDAELDQTAPFGPAGGRELPAAAMGDTMARHARDHLAHARAAVEGSA
jgi:hypothetical protein